MVDIQNKLKTKRILCAEDEESQLKVMEKTLKFFFKKVFVASDGEEALQILKEEQIDIAILDIEMPKITGMEVAQQIKNKNIMIVFLTAYTDQKYLLQAIKIKVEDYLIKPFSLNEFINIFERKYEQSTHRNKEKVHKLKNGKLFYIDTNLVDDSDNKIKLGNKESHLLKLLLQHSPNVLTKQLIDSEIWNYEMTESTYRSLVKNLRQKIGKELIKTIPGVGLVLNTK